MAIIGLDEEKIYADGYEPQSLWSWVDSVFSHVKWTKEPQPDGTVLYSSVGNSETLFADGYYIFNALTEDTNFGKYCNKWLDFNNDNNETIPFEKTDMIAKLRAYGYTFGR